MIISELVEGLEKIKRESGDIRVVYPAFMTDGCGAGEVLNMVVRKAKSPKKGSIFLYHRGAYAKSRYIRKDTKVVELRDFNYPTTGGGEPND